MYILSTSLMPFSFCIQPGESLHPLCDGPTSTGHQNKDWSPNKYSNDLRWHGRPSAEVNENINLGYSQDQGYS